MNTHTEKILTVTSKGQITIPMAWRSQLKNKHVLMRAHGDTLTITPVSVREPQDEYTVFDALRDNNGKGIKARDLIRILDDLK